MAALTVPATAPRMDFHPDAKHVLPIRTNSPRTNDQEFLFVNSSSTLSTRASRQYKGHRDVRRFVMQKARRARPWSTSKQPERPASQSRRGSRNKSSDPRDDTGPSPTPTQPSPSADSESQDSGVLTAPVGRCSICQFAVPVPGHPLCLQCCQACSPYSQPRDLVGDGLFDPFHTLPATGDIQLTDPDLWDQLCMMASRSPIPVDVRSQSNIMWSMWTAPALKHPAFLHSLLCAAALHRFVLDRGSFVSVAYHRSKAISLINGSLSNPVARLSDENIGAVFTLLCVEMSLSNPRFEEEVGASANDLNQVMVHLNGLRLMVDMRGGLGSLRTNRCLESFILRHSILNSVASFDAPYLLPYDENRNFCNYLEFVDPNRHPTSKLPLLLQVLEVDARLAESLYDSLTLSACLHDWYTDPASPYDPIDLQNQSGVLQCRLLQWLNEDLGAPRRPLDSALCISFLVFLVLVTDSFEPDLNPLHYRAIPQLKEALQATDLQDWRDAPELLIWMVTIGAICTWGSLESKCYFAHAQKVFSYVGIDSYSSLQRCLQACLWVPYKLDEGANLVWTNFTSWVISD